MAATPDRPADDHAGKDTKKRKKKTRKKRARADVSVRVWDGSAWDSTGDLLDQALPITADLAAAAQSGGLALVLPTDEPGIVVVITAEGPTPVDLKRDNPMRLG